MAWGLAATQVDVHKRVIVLDVSETRDQPLVLINPEILQQGGRRSGRGGMPVPARHLRQADPRHAHSRARAGPRRPALRNGSARVARRFAFSTKSIISEGKLFVDYLSELKRR